MVLPKILAKNLTEKKSANLNDSETTLNNLLLIISSHQCQIEKKIIKFAKGKDTYYKLLFFLYIYIDENFLQYI